MAALAVAGVALSLGYALVATDAGRAVLVPRLVRAVDDAIAGSIALRGMRLLPGGGVELLGLRIADPDGDVVLAVERLRVHADLSRLRSRAIGFRVEVESPAAVLKREEDGALSIARAFAPTHPSPGGGRGPPTWTIRLTRLSLRGGSLRYADAQRRTAFEVDGVDLDGRAAYGRRGARLELALRGTMVAPERAPISVEVAGGLRDTDLRVRMLRVRAGDTAIDAAAHLDTRSWRGRVAVLALAFDASQVAKALPALPLAADVAGTLYAESDGATASAALDLRPARGGAAEGAAAVRLPPGATAAGAEVRLVGLDLSRVLRGAPVTRIVLEARGHGSGGDLDTLRGAVSASLAPSRFRAGAVGPIELRATADRGVVEVARLDAAAPGVALHGRGRWRRGGTIAARVAVDASDLAAARRNGELLLARALPPMSGALRLDADVSGTARAPAVALQLGSASLGIGTAAVTALSVTGQVSGPASAPRAALDGTIGALRAGGLDARALRLAARVDGRAGEVSVTGEVPGLGPDALELRAAGQLTPDRRILQLTGLTLAWPGDRFELQQAARITLEPPSVDALVLASGPQRISATGGLRGPTSRRGVDALLRLQAVDLGLLPRALLPASLGVAGRVSAEISAAGPVAAPRVAARVELAEGAVVAVDGLSATLEVAWDGARRRLHVAGSGRRAAGGRLDVRAEVPIPLAAARRTEPLAVDAAARGWPVPLLLRAAGQEAPEAVDGVAGAEVHAGGTVGAPSITASVTLDGGRYGDFAPIAIAARLEDPGAEATLVASLDHAGARALDLVARVPLRLAEALRQPGAVARRLSRQPVAIVATVPSLDLATVAGRGPVPEELGGRVQARADVSGTLGAPRGVVTVSAVDVAYAGYTRLGAEVRLGAGPDATRLDLRASLGGAELAHGSASLALPPERLAIAGERQRAHLEARLDVPHADLHQASSAAPVALAGVVTGSAVLEGSLAAVRLDVAAEGRGMAVEGHPLGDATLRAWAREGTFHGELSLAAAQGGALDATLDVDAGLALASGAVRALRDAPARARLVASQLDLGFLPAVVPRLVRSASGKLGADIVATGQLTRLVPRGTLAMEGGAISVAEFGRWHDLTLRASLSEDLFRIERLEARRRGGKVTLTAEARGLARSTPADVTAELRSEGLAIPRGGQDLATLDLDARLKGTLSGRELNAELQIPGGTVRLPNRLPRQIQPLEERGDIVVGRPRRKPVVSAPGAEEPAPYHVRVHVLSPGHLFVKSDSPRMNIELRADVTADYERRLTLEGDVYTVRGQTEPIGGRVFDLKRGRVHFTGAALSDATLEIQAVYDNPAAKVNVAVSGTLEKPDMKLTSEPPMDESQIALLIATGHTELKAGSGGVGTLSREQAGYAALGAVATQLFKDVLADKLPVDSVALDSSQLRAGKYVTDKIYVGYTRKFNANPELGENTNEVRVEYQITPRWTFESRYGDAQSGGASVIWSKDY